MAGKRKTNPAGSTNSFRGDVLRVLGVLKVATADQIQRIGAPHLSFRHTEKPTASEQKTARSALHTGALSDMRKHGLSETGGSTETGERLRNLTIKGLEAASHELRRPVTEMGSSARGAGSSGGSHPMAVNETVIAMLRPKPDLAKLAEDPPEVRAAAQAAVDAPGGIGTIASYWTEVPLPATGTWNAPGKGGIQADIVLTAPQALATWSGDMIHPPVLLVFNRVGDRNPNRTIPRLIELTRHLWEGERQAGGFHHYDGRIPIIATGLTNLREHGPHGPVFLRFGRDHKEPLWEAIGNPRREAAEARARGEARARQEKYQAQLRRAATEQAEKKAAERETRRPVCAGCGAQFTDERWEVAGATEWGVLTNTHPHLCDVCKQRAVAAEGQAAGKQEHHEPVQRGVGRYDFQRETRRPVCSECGAQFTDERWKAIERGGWGAPPRAQPVLVRGLRPAVRRPHTRGLAVPVPV
ncbi:hypothetical protein ACFY04_43225 [Streptomyces sp. NPDC001549]|uniref:hypothetical protein n=1 Tax=Streptomyces sp. NPDC001549 TaxID=3364586 RepID=UPI00369B1181